jgi:putative transposase
MYDDYPQFFTATILEWKRLLKPDKYKEIIIESMRFLVRENRIKVYGFVIMPNHIHLIWRILSPYKRENVQRDFLKYTAQKIKADLQKNHPLVLAQFYVGTSDRKYQFWERNPLSVALYSLPILLQKLSYIHRNPIHEKWNLASQPEDYFYSSAAYYHNEQNDFDFLSPYVDEFL